MNAAEEQAVERFKEEMANQQAVQFIEGVRDICFKKCVMKPGTSLSSSEVGCLAKCCDRYVDAMQVVVKQLQKDQQQF